MISIITSKYENKIDELSGEKYVYIRYPWDYLEDIINKEGGISKELREIINIVEDTDITEDGALISKFTHKPINISNLSEGCKTIIYIYYSIKTNSYSNEIINITGCGENAIEYILKNFGDYNLQLFLGHYELPLDVECDFKLNGKLYHSTSELE